MHPPNNRILGLENTKLWPYLACGASPVVLTSIQLAIFFSTSISTKYNYFLAMLPPTKAPPNKAH